MNTGNCLLIDSVFDTGRRISGVGNADNSGSADGGPKNLLRIQITAIGPSYMTLRKIHMRQ